MAKAVARRKDKMAIPQEWSFKNKGVAEAFDAHVREQLPWYDLATGVVAHMVRCYLPEKGTVIDVGASTGNIGRAIARTLDARSSKLLAIDRSPQMAEVYSAPGELTIMDAEEFAWGGVRADVIVCFLSLMFVPVSRRRDLIERMAASLHKGGALIVFDKTLPRHGYLGTASYRLTLLAKYEAGAAPDEVIAKELSISGFQRPMQDDELAGFHEVFRFGDFAGFVREA